MGMNNWGGVTEHMYKKPRAVFGNKKNKELTSKELTKPKIVIDETEILQSKKRRLVVALVFWYGIPLLLILMAFLGIKIGLLNI